MYQAVVRTVGSPFSPNRRCTGKRDFPAYCLAHAWEAANGLPPEVARLFSVSVGTPELLLAIPEHQVSLPGGSTNSQADVFALLRIQNRTYAAAIEGKVDESFGPTIGEWMKQASEGKETRLRFVADVLGLSHPPAPDLRYQLFHRTASAIMEADRFKTDATVMIVHSFSPTQMWFEDYVRFLALFRASGGARPTIRDSAASQEAAISRLGFG